MNNGTADSDASRWLRVGRTATAGVKGSGGEGEEERAKTGEDMEEGESGEGADMTWRGAREGTGPVPSM